MLIHLDRNEILFLLVIVNGTLQVGGFYLLKECTTVDSIASVYWSLNYSLTSHEAFNPDGVSLFDASLCYSSR